MAQPNTDGSGPKKGSNASSLTSTSPPSPSQIQQGYLRPNQKPSTPGASSGLAPTRHAFPNLDTESIPQATTQHNHHHFQQQQAGAAAGPDIDRMSDSKFEMCAAHIPLSGTATAAPAAADTRNRVYGLGSPQLGPSRHLSLLASVSSTDIHSFDQTPVTQSPQSNRTHAQPTASAAHSQMDTRPSTVSTAAATRTATPSTNASAALEPIFDGESGSAACNPSMHASIRASSMPDEATAACLSFADAANVIYSSSSSHSSSAPVLCQPVESLFPRSISGIIDYDDEAAMETSSEDNSRDPQLPVSATSTLAYEGEDSRAPLHHGRTLSDSHIEPIRSLTGLALSPTSLTSPRMSQRQSLSLHTQRSSSERHAGMSDSSALQQILVRMDDIQRYCESLVQMQEQQAGQISSLEATIRQYNMPSFPHTPGTGSAGVTAAGPAAPLAQQALSMPATGGSGDEIAQGGTGAGAAEQAAGSIPQMAYPHQMHQSHPPSEQGATRAERVMHLSPGETAHRHYHAPPHHHQYYQYSRSPQRYTHGGGAAGHAGTYQPMSPTHRHLHQSRAAPYSTRTSPTMVPGRVQSPPAVRAARVQRLSAPIAPLTMSETPTARGRRDSVYQAQLTQSASSAWLAQQQLQQQQQHNQHHHHQQQQAGHGAMGNTQFASSGLATAGPGIDEREAHYTSAGSSSQHNMVPHGLSASAFGYPVSSSNATASSTNMAEHYSGAMQQPIGAGGLAGMRMKRVRMAESTDELVAASSSGTGESGHSPYYYQQQQHHLAPIRAGNMVRGGVEHRMSLSRAGGPGSLQLIRPDAVVSARTSRMAKDKGKAAASAEHGGNPEAQPTTAWLAGQRPYKNALLHLLTLESFYPTDVAMLSVFRNMGDFSNEQIEANAATMLSWARGWLRYNRNAVLRSTLDSKAKSPLVQLAEALQHDLHAETDFTAPAMLQRCALLRLIYLQWQSQNKLGTKSRSMYRDYEGRLREIEALPTEQEREAEWKSIMNEENMRRLALIRESRGSGGSAILPRPESRMLQQTPRQQVQSPALISQQIQQQQMPLMRRQSMEWPSHSGTHTPVPGQTHTPVPSQAHYFQQAIQQKQALQQHYRRAGVPVSSFTQSPPQAQVQHRFSHPIHPHQQELTHAFQAAHSQHPARGEQMDVDSWAGEAKATGKDDGSETSVSLSPEP
ncbi:hypothetical protein LPJ77_000899 [Coemansia sp. RSA 2523]|nr:hypothetical protein LPJ77_000899 [Coemansia sp. RSA 2523]KAJ2201151.1 hypothetical protein IW144_000554 [Coemansia sp. RSA 522]KAJ2292760.1 hypothetical protein IW141_001684 [Coemansia sp. RSA 355]